MKNALKKVLIAAAVLCVMAGLAGCSKNDAEGLAKSALKNLEKQDTAAMSVMSDMSAQISGDEIGSFSMSAVQKLDVSYGVKNNAVYTKGTYAQTLAANASASDTADMDISTEIESYTVTEDEKRVTYTRVEDLWMRMDGGTTSVDMIKDILSAVAAEKGTVQLDEEMQILDGQDVYVIHASIPSGEIDGIMSAGEGLLGQVGNVDDGSMPQITADIYIQKDSKKLAKIAVDMKDCGNYLIQSMDGASGSFDKYTMDMTITAWDSAGSIDVPQEVRDLAINTSQQLSDPGNVGSDPAGIGGGQENNGETTGYDVKASVNADGAWEIHLDGGDNVAFIHAPEGFSEDISSMYYLSLYNDIYVHLDYTYADLYDKDTIADEYKEMMSYLEDDANCSNVAFTDEKTISAGDCQVSYVCLTWNDESGSRAEYLAWTVDNGILFTCQITNLTEPDETLLKAVFENISFK